MSIVGKIKNLIGYVDDPFSRDTRELPDATDSTVVELRDGDVFDLRAAPVRKRIGDATVRMLAYNGAIPGPTLRVAQGSELTVRFTNQMDLETTVHWHGLRLDNRFDGVPEGAHHGMQAPIPEGGTFTYRLRFPDPGIHWYHPHMREDYTQEHGLYGNILVVPSDPDYWPRVNREVTLVVDDVLMARGQIAQFSRSEANRIAMGRFGNVMLVNGETSWQLSARKGEVVRFYLLNTANVRVFNVHIPGARMKLVGADGGRVEREEFVDRVLIAPSERAIVDVLFERGGEFAIEHRTPDKTYLLGVANVSDQEAEQSFEREFLTLRTNSEYATERALLAAELERAPDKTLALIGDMGHGGHHAGKMEDGIEWEDTMALMNRLSTPRNMFWKLVDRADGKVNHDIDWSFRIGDRIKIRLVNEPDSDHPMQHPIHFHGQRFLVLSRDGVPNENLAWKDTVLARAGETVDVLLEMTNPGSWMVHCHIAEHLESHMMLTFHVRGEDAPVMARSAHQHAGH
jgi:FtsP/CotA-like multicopper oxidase with cupredoxin domain